MIRCNENMQETYLKTLSWYLFHSSTVNLALSIYPVYNTLLLIVIYHRISIIFYLCLSFSPILILVICYPNILKTENQLIICHGNVKQITDAAVLKNISHTIANCEYIDWFNNRQEIFCNSCCIFTAVTEFYGFCSSLVTMIASLVIFLRIARHPTFNNSVINSCRCLFMAQHQKKHEINTTQIKYARS